MNQVNNPVIDLIKERYLSKSLPGKRNDNFKLGLAIEGGGMRGVVAASMASALFQLGLTDTFDAVYGSSAGALIGTFFITKQMPLGPPIFYDDLNNPRFINLSRLFVSNKNIMDLDFLIYDILVNRKTMNWKGVIDSKIPLNIVVSSINQRKSIGYNNYKNKEELFTLLKASANIPFVAGKPIEYNGDLLFDALLYESIPYKKAIEDGCTHILTLLTRPLGKFRSSPSFIQKNVIAPKMKNLKNGLDEDYLNGHIDYNKSVNFLLESNHNSTNKPFIYSICPDKNEDEVKRLEKNRNKLINGAISGMNSVMKTFGINERLKYFEILYPTNDLGLVPNIK